MEQDIFPSTLSAADLSLITVLSILILITIIGNFLVITAVTATSNLRTVTNFFILSLAVADLLVGILIMPIAALKEVTTSWTLGSVLCELWTSTDVMLCTASVLNILCISIDRYRAVKNPLNYKGSSNQKNTFLIIAGVWGLSALITCPPMFGWHEWDIENQRDCNYTNITGYVLFSSLCSFFIPAFIMVLVYCRVFTISFSGKEMVTSIHTSESPVQRVSEVKQPRPTIHEVSESELPPNIFVLSDLVVKYPPGNEIMADCNGIWLPRQTTAVVKFHPDVSFVSSKKWNESASSTMNTSECLSTSKQQLPPDGSSPGKSQVQEEDNSEKLAFRKERRLAAIVAMVAVGFIVCWTPFFVIYVLTPFCPQCEIHPVIRSSVMWFGWINSAINPVIYGLNYKALRKAFVRVTVGKCLRKRYVHDAGGFQ